MKRSFFLVIPLVVAVWFVLEPELRAVPPAPPSSETRARPRSAAPPPKAAPSSVPAGSDPAAVPRTTTDATRARFLAIGGGATPEYTEVSLEQDMQLALQVLPGPGMVFFAGGAESSSVRLLNRAAQPNALLARLGDLFAPRIGRQSTYRRTTLPAEAASASNVDRALERALAAGGDRLLVYIAAHGEQGGTARQNYVGLWGGDPLAVARIAELHDVSPRPLRMVVASCFSGGFGELAFHAANPSKGFTHAPRCGLFAGPWDRQTSGCDPNPDRGAQEGYSIHVLHALRGQDRHGQPLPAAEIDFDGDGRIGLLEAHTRARIASSSIDVPTTTSERYLREVEHRHGPIAAAGLPEDAALVARLGKLLEVPTRARAEQRWRELTARLDGLDERLHELEVARERAAAQLAAKLLGRWPVLDDPYHAEFAPTLQKHGKAITAVLESSPEARQLREANAAIEALDRQLRELEPQEAMVMRLLRSYETLSLAAALAKRGGAKYQNYRALLACERAPL